MDELDYELLLKNGFIVNDYGAIVSEDTGEYFDTVTIGDKTMNSFIDREGFLETKRRDSILESVGHEYDLHKDGSEYMQEEQSLSKYHRIEKQSQYYLYK